MSGLINSAGSRSGVIGTTELDYEEGTWTTTCNNGVTLDSGFDLGSYTKTGRMVTCGGQFKIDSSNSSAVLVFNLPFTSRANAGENSGLYTCAVRTYSLDLASNAVWVIGYIGTNTTSLEFVNIIDNGASTSATATDSAYIMFSITYPTAS